MAAKSVIEIKRDIALKMRGRGATLQQIADDLDVSLRTVSRWLKSPPKKAGRRAPRDTARRVASVREIAQRTVSRSGRTLPLNPTFKKVGEVFNAENGLNVSVSTIRRLVALGGGKSRVRPWHPNLAKKEERKAFAKIWRARCPDKIVFSDEHFISTNDLSYRRQILYSGDELLARERQRRQNVANFQLWAAIGVGWRSQLVFFPKKRKKNGDDEKSWALNQYRYVRMCLSKVKNYLRDSKSIFMQDGAKCHTANSVKAYLARNNITLMEDFPASSPDLNPIESLWAELNRRIAEKMPSTEAELKAAAIEAWNEIPQEVIDRHVRSFQRKCEKVALD